MGSSLKNVQVIFLYLVFDSVRKANHFCQTRTLGPTQRETGERERETVTQENESEDNEREE